MGRKPGRPKLGEEILSRDRIVEAALFLVDTEGVDKLSMRRLAGHLGVDPMAIYRHVPDKAALTAGMVELVFGAFRATGMASASHDEWRDQVRGFAAAYRALVRSHPNLIVYLTTHIEASLPAVLAVGEFLAAALRQAGLSPLQVVTASNLIVDYLNGYALGESSGLLGAPGEYGSFYAMLAALPEACYPAMRATYAALDEATLQAHHADGLELILAGIEAWLQPGASV